jgi:hypothetical protein
MAPGRKKSLPGCACDRERHHLHLGRFDAHDDPRHVPRIVFMSVSTCTNIVLYVHGTYIYM